MPRKVQFRGNTLVLNDEAPVLKTGDRVCYTVHDWMEGEHTISGEVLLRRSDGTVRVKIGRSADGARDLVHEVPTEALTVIAPVIPLKGER